MNRRGRGKSRGRGGRFRGGNLSRKQISHIQQFGEAHPSEELSKVNDFGPSEPKKFKGKYNGRDRFPKKPQLQESSASSESDSEDEQTPFSELLTLASGKKSGKVEILSSEEEESDSEANGTNDDSDESEVQDEEESANANGNSESSSIVEVSTNEKSEQIDTNEGDVAQAEEEEGDGIENADELEPVITEQELDPEADDELGGAITSNNDPFVLHFEHLLPEDFVDRTKSGGKLYDVQIKGEYPVLEHYNFSGVSPSTVPPQEKVDSCLDSFSRPTINIPGPPSIAKLKNLSIDDLHIKPQLKSRIGVANQVCLDAEMCKGPLTPFQTELLSILTEYRDLCYPQRNFENGEAIRTAYCIHVANHVLKTRTRILHHNAKLANKMDVPEEYRDQSFVRPKVVIVLPFRESALKVVKTLISLFLESEKGNVVNKKRFVAEYGGETLFMPKTNPKPDDYMKTFAGNVDDNFRIGISITKKSIKLFSDFYSSDIIIASPLGLRLIIGAEGESDRDYDFLSSVELLIFDQAEIFYMQSWDHVLHLFKHMHLKPVTTHGTDFSRIRPWALDDLSKFYCQTVIFSSVSFPELNGLFSKYCKNYAGLVKFVNPIARGSICHVTSQLPQVYQRFQCSSLAETHDARFQFFLKKVLPNFSGNLMTHTLIFIPSYFDFVRIRNHFKREDVSFVQICEYTKDKKIARARDLFFHNKNQFMLYTERAMFFRRLRLKGIGHIIFYQLPQNPQLYAELCNLVQEDFQSRKVRLRKNASVTALYCQYDASRLAAVVGSDRAKHMITSDKDVHAFVTGQL